MKAVIPVAGVGTKLRPHTHTIPKALVSVAGKPIIGHIIDFLIEGGISEFVFIIGHLGSRIEDYVREHYQTKVRLEFVIQRHPREGSAHAIWMAKHLLENEKEILIALGDTIINLDIKAFLQTQGNLVGVYKVPNPTKVGIAEINRDNTVKRFVEKPKIPKSNLGLVGIYKITHVRALLDAIAYLFENNLTTNGEYHLTDALMEMLVRGQQFATIEVSSWHDCGEKDSLLAANALLLNRFDFEPSNETFPNTIIIHPVKIDSECTINNCIIGPNVVIGSNSSLQNCIINNSIVGSYSSLENLILNNSLLGNDTFMRGASQSLNVGDNTEISFGE